MNSPHQSFSRRRSVGQSAFSLIELLTVMAMISMLAVATVPALRGTLDGINVSGAAGLAESEILLARQTAISRNLPVEVRFYKHDDGTGDAWRVVAVVIPASASGQTADEWITSGKILPGNVVIQDTNDFSTVLEKAAPLTADKIAPWSSQESSSAPKLVQNKNYVGFRFNPDGSTNLPNGQPWCLTLKNPRSQSVGGAPASNYVSIVLDSLTGRTMTYQP
ncbi:MAG: Verru_Chthon cassette protein D [Terrimicrobiaceae bacterium]